MPTYSEAPGSVRAMIDNLIDQFHPDLAEASARVGAVFAYPTLDKDGEPTGPAVTAYGMAAEGKVKANSEADRVEGKPDATITLDAGLWREWDEEDDGHARQKALVDRFLYALEVRKTDGAIVTDDRGRPKLKVKKPDWCISGFRAMADRHGRHSAEVRQARQLHDAYGNLLFNFAEDLAEPSLPGIEAGKPKRRNRGAAAVAAANR